MKKYLVLRTNHGFKGRYWVEGQTVSFEDNVVPPHHFQLITEKTKLPEAEKFQVEPTTLSALQGQVKKTPTAAQALKDDVGVAQKPLTEEELKAIAALNEGSEEGGSESGSGEI